MAPVLRMRMHQPTNIVLLWVFIFVVVFFVFGPNSHMYSLTEGDVTPEEFIEEVAIEDLIKEIHTLRIEVVDLRRRARTLEDELAIIKKDITLTGLEIEKSQLLLGDQSLIIEQKRKEIARIDFEISNREVSLIEGLRIFWQDYDDGVIEILLKNNSLSDFFDGLNSLRILEDDLRDLLENIEKERVVKEKEQKALEGEHAKQAELSALLLLQTGVLFARERIFEGELIDTLKQDYEISGNLTELRHDLYLAREDRGEFRNLGITLPFEEVVTRAEQASQHTGVRTSLLLALLKVESNFGSFVGGGNWKADMHPRDWEAFEIITRELGFDPDTTPVSAQPAYGWGGAMGPAQFLPQTWLGYRERVSELTGHKPSSPWNLEDALTAAALKLSASGASTQKYEDEWRSAMIYFAGENWDDPSFSFYGDIVIEFAELFEEELEGEN